MRVPDKYFRLSAVFSLALMASVRAGAMPQQGSCSDPSFVAAIRRLTSGLAYSGEVEGTPHDIGAHSMGIQPLPAAYSFGKLYIFHMLRGDERTHLAGLVKQMKAGGATIITPPGEQREMTGYVGGPFYRVELEIEGQRVIFSTILDPAIVADPEPGSKYEPNDLVMVVKPSRH